MRKARLQKWGNRCAICGVSGDDAILEVHHVVPKLQGGSSSPDNVVLCCANCHYSGSSILRESEFSSFLAECMKLSEDYKNVTLESVFNEATRFRVDIFAEDNRAGRCVIEAKSYYYLSEEMAEHAVAQLRRFKKYIGSGRYILAIVGIASESAKAILSSSGVELWDRDYISSTFEQFSNKISGQHFSKILFFSQQVRAEEQSLINKLAACKPGKKDAYLYQDLVGKVIEQAFCPPLNTPISESNDLSKANRRDFIVPNYADSGFWAYVREKYGADYVVVDAKNLKGRVSKNDVLQIANYLKPHGAGRFGIIFSRNGGDKSGCWVTQREQWILHEKMIIILDDNDCKAIVEASEDNAAENILSSKIEQFRLSF